MIQARKDVNAPSKEQKAEEQVVSTTSQRITPSSRTIHAVEQRRATYVTNTLGTPTTVILPEGSSIPESGALQFRRISLGQQLQHVVTPVQVQGTSSTSESLPISSRCTVTSTQDLPHILVATTSNAPLHTVELQNSIVNVSASMPQYQTLGNITNVATGGQRTAGNAVIAQPVTQTTIAPRIVLNSGTGMSDVYALRITPTTIGGGSATPQIMLLDSSASLNPSSDVTKVHSYSLASAAVSSLGSTNTMQKIVISTGQTLQVTGLAQKPLANPSRASVKRQLIATTPTRTELSFVNNNDVLSHISVVNKLLYGLMPFEGKISSIPSSPKSKRIKLDKQPVTNKDVIKRRKVIEHLTRKIQLLKNKYYQTQTEFYFLKTGSNMADYVMWRKKIPSTLLDYLKAHRFDPHDDVKIILEVLSQSVSQSTGNPVVHSQGPHADHPLLSKTVSHATSSHSQSLPHRTSLSPSSQRSAPVSSTPSTPTKSVRQPTLSHKLAHKHNSISSVYDSQIGSQEEIVERAKQEAYVMQRVGELRKDGLWSLKRLPKVAEAPRNKAHYDYLLEEMVWLATDFAQERKWKKANAKKCARMITKYFQEKEIKAERAEREEQIKLRKIASTIAREVKQFWNNIEKLVEYKHQTWLEEKRKKVLDVHLNFIVDQTEKYSSWLTQGMNQSNKGSPESSRGSSPLPGSASSTPLRRNKRRSFDFEPSDSEEDDEETIKMEEENIDKGEQDEEIKLLQQESEMPFEDFLDSLPPEILNTHVSLDDSKDKSDLSLLSIQSDVKPEKGSDDDDFEVSEEEEDDEQTILEQEENEDNVNHEEEIKDLEAENEMSIEQLREKYAAAYASDFEVETSEQQSEDEREIDDSEDEQSDEDMSVDGEDKKEHALLKSLTDETDKDDSNANPTKEITDIAATAESFQPKGNTLSTTQVCTKVPFLLKHQLREYQHIGLDWLNAMYDKKLNGILADEMGLGKTIQTISILAHLACEKGVWGPHLIVVPTSVMLNWEMEFKKWCPAFKILTYYGTPKERKQKRVGWTKFNAFHVCITSYKLVVQDHQSFRRKKWKYLILDEAHHIKNFKSQRWQLLLNFQSSHRLLLTGTPLQNNLMELWSLMHFLMPNVFQSHKEFREWFVNPFTGMIEGSHEYNDSLIKRLHKVLRPFLLRRLKCEVEKQLPKKYEHIIVCRLSNRQRYLYDDFMSQTKTKETLATGNFMSVINILMQLRKVCNHPNMFEERPTVSPFLMEGVTFHTSSLASKALEYDPFKQVNLQSLNLLLADLELSLTAFAAHRVRKFQTPPKLIVEIDNLPEPPPPCPAVKMKVNFCNTQGASNSAPPTPLPRIASPAVAHPSRLPSSIPNRVTMPIGPALPQPQRLMVIPGQQGTPSRAVSPVAAIGSPPVASQPEQYTLQLVQPSGAVASLAPLGGLTLQLQPGPASGNRVQCIQSLIGGIGRVVQTAAGAHFVITSVANSVAEHSQVQPAATTAIAQPHVAASVSNTQSLVLSTNISTATVLPQVQKIGSPAVAPQVLTTFSRPPNNNSTSSMNNQSFHNKPIGRVAPLNVHPPVSTTSSAPVNQNHVQNAKGPVVHSLSKTLPKLDVPSSNISERQKSIFYIESLAAKREKERKDTLRLLAKINNRRCTACPIYGDDLIEAVTIVNSLKHPQTGSAWFGKGYVNCLNAINAQNDPSLYWDHTSILSNIIKTPDERLDDLKEIINRFVFVVPKVSSPSMKIHISHPSPWRLNEERMIEERLINYVSPASAFLHPIVSNMKTQFPELRLIQYDCGKLQRLAGLLWELKSGHHRVLIFTQMTRMLDILEQFLNYHGHTYLRLDGNTKVEQRQALMERFNADKRIFCFILSTRSGGIGVNLTGADTVIFYDSDWNPTMDAQAQDRCHRIGQTRDVHIYRLISERTIEENILRKANQKRVLGDLAIEGGNFNTAFFKKNTIHELFGISMSEEVDKSLSVVKKVEENVAESSPEEFSQTQLEQALGLAEDESDKKAAQTACAEAVAELAEFDESIPLDNEGREIDDKSPAEEELDKLMKQLTPVEKYAVQFLESLQEPVGLEQLKLAEEEIEAQKKDWELGHLKALKEEEERRFGDDDSPLFYSREAANQVYFSVNGQEEMPLWAPPTPPTNENDLYIDYSVAFWYEPSIMHEARLPPVFIKKEAKRQKIDPVISAVTTTRKQKVRKDDMVNIPRSLFDRPSAAILKLRREVKLQKVKGLMVGTSGIPKPLASFPGLKPPPIVVNKPTLEVHIDKPDWLVQEDWAILQVIQDIQSIPLNLTILLPGHLPNWDMAGEAVHAVCQNFRSAKSCKIRYENVVIPREEGKILYDTNPKKQKKTKGIYKKSVDVFQTKNNRPMKTSQLYIQDNNGTFSKIINDRFKLLAETIVKRKTVERPSFSLAPKNPKPPENPAINFDVPLSPKKIACNRAERIARDKQKNMAPTVVATQAVSAPTQVQATVQAMEQQIAAQRQVTQQATVTVAGTTNIIPHQAQAVIASLAQAQQLQQVQLNKANIQQGTVTSVSLPKSLTSGIMVNAAAGSTTAGTLATLTKALGQAGVTSLTSQGAAQNAAIAAALSNANLRNQRAVVTATGATTTMTVQEMVAAAQVRGLTTAAGVTSTAPAVVSVANLTAVQLASQRLTGTTLSPATTIASVSQLNTQAAATQRNISQLSQLQALRQSALIRQREQQTIKQQQQQLKRLQTVQQQQASQPATKVAIGTAGTLTVAAAAQQRITQQVTMKQSVGRAVTEAEMAQLVKRQQLQQQKQAQLTTAQILAQAQLQQVQPQQVSITGGTATLVKTVSAPLSGASSLAIPVSAVTMGGVNINVSVPQGKAGTIQTKGGTTLTTQQIRHFQMQQLLQARKGNKLTTNLTQLATKVPAKGTAVSASSLSAAMNAVQIVQHNPQVGTTQQVKGIPATMTVQQIQQAMKQAIPQNLPVVVTATPSLPGIQQQHTSATLRGEPGVVGSVKAQTTTLPSTTLTTSGVLKGAPAVVVGQQQTAAILQQVAASSSGITPQAVTLAVRTAAQTPGQQVQIQVQQTPHSSLVTPQSQVVSAALQTSQARMQQLSQGASINIAQPVAVQNAGQASSILTSTGTLMQQVPADSTLQSSTHVVMHNVVTSSSTPILSIPATLANPPPVTTQTPAQVVQAAIQAARQQQQQQQAAQKASPYTMRLRNPPK
ncbi:helicase domino isoform X2 [Parasteatoda tepidariorum]|uniref:helicase domino isoform X2 n=1 Tax=Parasteatoda tepidariorum TaxID=114398 RepID=UPI001C72359F|nr:helicase domino isoform X2 [Parasteatoda tepidariorum]